MILLDGGWYWAIPSVLLFLGVVGAIIALNLWVTRQIVHRWRRSRALWIVSLWILFVWTLPPIGATTYLIVVPPHLDV